MPEAHPISFHSGRSTYSVTARASDGSSLHIGDNNSMNIDHQTSVSLETLLRDVEAKEAQFDFDDRGRDEVPREYHEGTRLSVLNDIYRWIDADQGCIFWLNGMAGTGKSSIAREVARHCNQINEDRNVSILTSFFFSNQYQSVVDAKHFVTSIAAQLSRKCDPFSKLLEEKLKKDQGIPSRLLESQWKELIMESLSKINRESPVQVVIVIDALDQCQNEADIQQLLKIIEYHAGLKERHFKFLVTSRREESIRFSKDIERCDLDMEPVDEDIRKYLKKHLTESHIPTSDIDALADKCEGLFICAATAKKYIQGKPRTDRAIRLRQTLDDIGTSDTGRALERIYSTVMQPLSMSERSQTDCTDSNTKVRSVLGDIGILFSPLRMSSLSKLLAKSENEIKDVIESYGAIFHHPMEGAGLVRIHHSYFSDFLFDEVRSGFHISREEKHREMISHCLNLMKNHLKQNICDAANVSVTIAEMAMHNLEPEMEYACRHWIQHLLQVQFQNMGNPLVEFIRWFLEKHFIEWMEAMSVLKRTSDAVRGIKELRGYFALNSPNQSLIIFLKDAERFILKNRQMADKAPLQLYSSGLMFCPESSVIREYFKNTLSEEYNLRKRNEKWNKVLQSLEGHSHWINSVGFSSGIDTKLVASGSADYTVSLWDHTTGELCMTHGHHSRQVNCVAFSPDDTLLASGSDDMTIKIWDHAKNEIFCELSGHMGHITSIDFSPGLNGDLMASGSDDGSVRVWKYRTGSLYKTLPDGEGPVNSVVFLPNNHGTKLIAVTDGRAVKLWDYDREEQIETLYRSPKKASLATFSPDGHFLAFAFRDFIKIWDRTTHSMSHFRLDHSGRVTSIAFSPGSRALVAAGSQGGSIRIWDHSAGLLVQTLNCHSEQVRAVAFSSHHGARLLVSGANDRLIKMWDVNEGDTSYQEIHPAKPSYLAFSPDACLLASCSRDDHVKMWDSTTGDLKGSDMKHHAQVKSIAFSPDGRILASAADDRKVMLWDPNTCRPIKTLDGYNKASTVAFSPDSKMIAYGSVKDRVNVVTIVNLYAGWEAINSTDTHEEVNIVAFSPNNKRVASTTTSPSDNTIRVWDSSTGQIVFQFSDHTKKILSLSFSPSSHLIASGSADYTAKIWDYHTGELRMDLGRHDSWVKSVQFSPDGKLLATTSHVETTKLWNVASDDYEHRQTLKGHSGLLWSKRGGFVTIEASQWLCFNGKRRLSLPVEYRKSCMALQKNIIALGSSNGQVSFISVPEDAHKELCNASSALSS